MLMRIVILILSVFSALPVFAQQSSVTLLAEVPVQFGIGYEGKLSERFSVSLQGGVLSEPNSSIIIAVLGEFGTDEEIVLMIENAFKFGVVAEAGVNYNFRRNYVGIYSQMISLTGGDTPTDLIETYFNEDIDSYPARRGRTSSKEVFLTLKSTLYQVGILYGRRIPLSTRLSFNAEFAISANVGSKSNLNSDTRELDALSSEVDEELDGYFSSFAYVPSISIGLCYALRKNR
jgi:hypothetical protein